MPENLIIDLPYSENREIYQQFISGFSCPVALESLTPERSDSRYSVYAADPVQSIKVGGNEDKDSPVDLNDIYINIRSLWDEYFIDSKQLPSAMLKLPFAGGLLGYMAYPQSSLKDEHLISSAFIGVYLWALIHDTQLKTCQLIFHPSLPKAERTRIIAQSSKHFSDSNPQQDAENDFKLSGGFKPVIDFSTYRQAFDKIKQYINKGDVYQVNLTQEFRAACVGSPLSAYQQLSRVSPAPFSAYLHDGKDAVLSFSPERFIELNQGRVETKPIKGTRLRLDDKVEDRAQKLDLVTSLKDRAENLMIVDLLRNDLGKVSRTGSIRVPSLFELQTFSNVHHLVTTITAKLAEKMDAIDLLSACFPGGSITGAPKLRAMEIIDELEASKRGPYCGSVFYFNSVGDFDSSIAIRTMAWRNGGKLAKDQLQCWAGGGIVADSEASDEYDECFSKVQNLLDALPVDQDR